MFTSHLLLAAVGQVQSDNRIHAKWGKILAGVYGEFRDSKHSHVGVRKQAAPRGVEIEPALCAEPAGWHVGNVQQSVSADANEFSAIPTKKIPRRLTDVGRMRE